MYKVYINTFLKRLFDYCYAISINCVTSFQDDLSLPALYPSFPKTFMNICHTFSIKWRHEINDTKHGVVTFGETRPLRSKSMKEREWMLGDAIVNEPI